LTGDTIAFTISIQEGKKMLYKWESFIRNSSSFVEDKMKKMKLLTLAAALILLVSGSALGQANVASHTVTMEVGNMAVLNLTGGNITLTIAAPGTGGQQPADDTDNTCYLQYTATVPSGMTRTLTVAWEAGDTAPGGCELRVTTTPSGQAGEGSTAGQRTISSSGQAAVTSIGSCYTGTGGTDGANLSYVLTVTDPSSLVAGDSEAATVTYTLTDSA
jgi:hypothetical protein